MDKGLDILEHILAFSADIRYAAIYKHGDLLSKEKRTGEDHSAAESDQYEELFVNPVLLRAASQRGNLDCGGLRYIIVAYGNFYQLVKEINGGHISICVQKSANIDEFPQRLFTFLKEKFNYYLYKM